MPDPRLDIHTLCACRAMRAFYLKDVGQFDRWLDDAVEAAQDRPVHLPVMAASFALGVLVMVPVVAWAWVATSTP
jgi:hypothetical protein